MIIQVPFASPLYCASIQLRMDILRKPLNLEFGAQELALEWDQFHFVKLNNNFDVIGVAVLKKMGEGLLKMRQVAIAAEIQGLGTGSELMIELENWSRRNKFHTIELHARETALNFYEKLNYQIRGNSFFEVGMPHFYMFKSII